mgnify:FL=1
MQQTASWDPYVWNHDEDCHSFSENCLSRGIYWSSLQKVFCLLISRFWCSSLYSYSLTDEDKKFEWKYNRKVSGAILGKQSIQVQNAENRFQMVSENTTFSVPSSAFNGIQVSNSNHFTINNVCTVFNEKWNWNLDWLFLQLHIWISWF